MFSWGFRIEDQRPKLFIRLFSIMLWPIIFLVAASTAKCDGIIQAKTLTAFVQQFRAPQQLPIIYRTPKETKIKLIKLMSKENATMDWVNQLNYTERFLLLIIERPPRRG